MTVMTAEELVGPLEAFGISCCHLIEKKGKAIFCFGEIQKFNIPLTAAVIYSMRDFPGP